MSDTHTVLRVQVPAGSAYIDLAYELSTTNHRLYRQGRTYHADVIATPQFAAGGNILVQSIAPTWMNKKAWQLGFETWRKSTEHEREAGTRAGRWNDFRVYFDASHAGTPAITNGEYQYTTAVFSDGSGSRNFQMFGATSASRFGLVTEYDATRDTNTDIPAAGAASAAYDKLLEELNNSQADQIQEEGDLPPYNSVNLSGTIQRHDLQSPLSSNLYRTGMMQIPCGLLKITSDGGIFQIKVKSGKYKGVHAEAMS
jgi:hypothetical protein